MKLPNAPFMGLKLFAKMFEERKTANSFKSLFNGLLSAVSTYELGLAGGGGGGLGFEGTNPFLSSSDIYIIFSFFNNTFF
jgi:hypothetical protein